MSTRRKTESDAATKRGPGRPPSTTKRLQVARLGICDKPLHDNNLIEFYFAIPIVFKKLWNLYKATNVEEIVFQFTPDGVVILARSFSDRCTFRTYIDGSLLHRYYCGTPLMLKMGRNGSEKIMNRIDTKFYDSINLVVEKANEITFMNIILNNPLLKAPSTHKLNLSTNVLNDYEESWDSSSYPLSFELDRQSFKKYISDIDTISDTLMIEKIQGSPIKFKYSTDGGIVSATETFTDGDKIKIKDKMLRYDLEIVATTIKVSDIKPLSNTQIADKIRIYVDSQKKMLFKVIMDDAIETKILIAVETYE